MIFDIDYWRFFVHDSLERDKEKENNERKKM